LLDAESRASIAREHLLEAKRALALSQGERDQLQATVAELEGAARRAAELAETASAAADDEAELADRLRSSEARAAAAESKAIVLSGQLASFKAFMEAEMKKVKAKKMKKKAKSGKSLSNMKMQTEGDLRDGAGAGAGDGDGAGADDGAGTLKGGAY